MRPEGFTSQQAIDHVAGSELPSPTTSKIPENFGWGRHKIPLNVRFLSAHARPVRLLSATRSHSNPRTSHGPNLICFSSVRLPLLLCLFPPFYRDDKERTRSKP